MKTLMSLPRTQVTDIDTGWPCMVLNLKTGLKLFIQSLSFSKKIIFRNQSHQLKKLCIRSMLDLFFYAAYRKSIASDLAQPVLKKSPKSLKFHISEHVRTLQSWL